MLSGAIAGMYKNKVTFIILCSLGAVKIAMKKLIHKELVHIVKEVKK